MLRGIRSCVSRLAVAGASVMAACASLACGALLGVDDGTPRGDASTGGPGDSDVTMDGSLEDGGLSDASDASDGTFLPDGGFHVDAEAGCTPDLSWCNTH